MRAAAASGSERLPPDTTARAVAIGLWLLYALPTLPQSPVTGVWSFNALGDVPGLLAALLLLGALVGIVAPGRVLVAIEPVVVRAGRPWARRLNAVGAATFLLLLSERRHLGDADLYLGMIEQGHHWNPNSPLCFLVIGTLFDLLSPFGVSAQALWASSSILAGIVTAEILRRQVLADGTLLTVLPIACLASSSLFFGHVETYAPLVPLCLMVASAARAYLEGGKIESVAWPFGLALAWSLSIGWAAPALAYLVVTAPARSVGRRALDAVRGGVVSLLPVTGAFLAGLALGHGAGMFRHLHLRSLGHAGFVPWHRWFELRRLADVVSEQVFLGAGVYLLLLLEAPRLWSRLRHDRQLQFLGLLLILGQSWAAIWNPQRGIYADWDLFALTALPAGMLAARLIQAGDPYLRRRALWLLSPQLAHTLGWILASRFQPVP